MKYPLPRKMKKALKKGDCAKSILFEIILEENGPKAAVRMLKQWGRVCMDLIVSLPIWANDLRIPRWIERTTVATTHQRTVAGQHIVHKRLTVDPTTTQ